MKFVVVDGIYVSIFNTNQKGMNYTKKLLTCITWNKIFWPEAPICFSIPLAVL